jgi:hypothetical protein
MTHPSSGRFTSSLNNALHDEAPQEALKVVVPPPVVIVQNPPVK